MVRVIVVYDTKYGNTKLAAEKIIEGISEVEGIREAREKNSRMKHPLVHAAVQTKKGAKDFTGVRDVPWVPLNTRLEILRLQ